jgi:hypothetical protein
MPKYLDGVQSIDDVIQEFKTVATGTVDVGTNQYPNTGAITKPTKLYKNYVLLINNKSGQTIATFTAYTVTDLIPNVTNKDVYGLVSSGGNQSPASVGTNTAGSFEITSENINPFVGGKAKFQFNLAAAPTSGTIDWALIGY